VRWCSDIGMHAVDRPIPETCVHATEYCALKCYNLKLYKLYPAMRGADARWEEQWQSWSGEDYADALARKQVKPTDRLRLMTRGEALSDYADVDRVADIARAVSPTLVWCPTRAWRSPLLRGACEGYLSGFANLVILASLDPSNTEAEYRDLVSAGWSTMYFGKKGEGWNGPASGFDCPKTAKPRRVPKGHCGVCKAGCFAPILLGRRVDVRLREH
jgi:hypothetical protein